MNVKPCNSTLIDQLDGNMSISESESSYSPPNTIPPRPDKIVVAGYLPVVACYNFRSLFPKVNNAKNDIKERGISLALCSEIWQNTENLKHKSEIENMLESEGLQYISTPRPSGWGGAAIIVDQQKFNLEKLDICIPHKLEVVWGILKCKDERAIYKRILVCSFYSPPNSKKNLKLTDHLISTLHMLSTKYPDAPIIMGADKNRMDLHPLLNCGLRLKNMVDISTRKGAILDVIITNIPKYYNSAIVVPPVPCDDPSSGVPSDHWVPICYPHMDRHRPPLRRFKSVTYRPLPDDGIRKYGQWITSESFAGVGADMDSTEHAQVLQDLLLGKLDKFCPTRTMRVSSKDKPYINTELKTLSRRKQREYIKRGKTEKYNKLATEFRVKLKLAAKKYMCNKIDELKETQPGRAYNVLKTMGAQPGDSTDEHTFSLPVHLDLNLTDQECADRIAAHFAAISNQYPPLNRDTLADRVKERLQDGSRPPIITDYECYQKLKAAKKPASVIPGDLPSKVAQEFMVELASPLCKLFNKIAQSAIWPLQWRMEYITPIPKIPLPQTEEDLRPISLTSFYSKVMEGFVVTWLLHFIGGRMDFRQYGGTKGNSIVHYLIEFLNFILLQQESKSRAVLACLVDFSKAFNRQDHNILITKLSDLGVPGWLLHLVVAFLEHRSMMVKYKGKYSSIFNLPGGGPQGTLLGLFLFLVLVNDAGFTGQTNNAGQLITCKERIKEMNEIHLKFVDDLTIAESIDMTNQLRSIPVSQRPQPDCFRARTGHELINESSKVYTQLQNIQAYADTNKMKLNIDKTKLMLFNTCKNKDFMPDFELGSKKLDLVEKAKLLGVVVSSDLSWEENTAYIVKRCNQKIWIIKRLKKLGARISDLLDVYCKQVRCIAEYAVPVWNSALTGIQVNQIERIQKTAFHVILGNNYTSYSKALKLLGMPKLSDRRRQLCLKFARKCEKHPKFSKWFIPNKKKFNTRLKPTKYEEVFALTQRFEKSPLSYLTNVLNQHYLKKGK